MTSGWISVGSPPGGGTSLRVTRKDGRWVVSEVYVHADEITSRELQAVPVTFLGLAMNLMETDLSTLDVAMRYSGSLPMLDATNGEPSLAELRRKAEGAPAEIHVGPFEIGTESRPRLTRPDGSDTDGFYSQVAKAYREYVLQGQRAPAAAIAREAVVPVGTARRWINEARRYGKLPAGRKGKAG